MSKFILCILFVLCSVGRGDSLRCYTCFSEAQGECYKMPGQYKFIRDCEKLFQSKDVVDDESNMNSSTVISHSNKSQRANRGSSLSIDESDYECASFEGTAFGMPAVARECKLRSLSCRHFMEMYGKNDFEVETCRICNYNYCNSSDQLKLRFWSVIILPSILACWSL